MRNLIFKATKWSHIKRVSKPPMFETQYFGSLSQSSLFLGLPPV